MLLSSKTIFPETDEAPLPEVTAKYKVSTFSVSTKVIPPAVGLPSSNPPAPAIELFEPINLNALLEV